MVEGKFLQDFKYEIHVIKVINRKTTLCYLVIIYLRAEENNRWRSDWILVVVSSAVLMVTNGTCSLMLWGTFFSGSVSSTVREKNNRRVSDAQMSENRMRAFTCWIFWWSKKARRILNTETRLCQNFSQFRVWSNNLFEENFRSNFVQSMFSIRSNQTWITASSSFGSGFAGWSTMIGSACTIASCWTSSSSSCDARFTNFLNWIQMNHIFLQKKEFCFIDVWPCFSSKNFANFWKIFQLLIQIRFVQSKECRKATWNNLH